MGIMKPATEVAVKLPLQVGKGSGRICRHGVFHDGGVNGG
jgi:hypothetical protein